jgi:hypothetical protein
MSARREGSSAGAVSRWKCHTSFTNRMIARVADPGCALRFTVIALLSSVLIYSALHCLVPHQPVDFSQAVVISADGHFRCYYRDDILDRFFSRQKVNEWKQRMDEKAAALRSDALGNRRALLLPLQQFVRTTLSDQAGLVESWTSGPEAATNVLSTSLSLLQGWLRTQREAVQPQKRALVDEFIDRLGAQAESEIALRSRLLAEIAGLKSNLSFDWFFIDGWKWIIEVCFWCTFGVLANTFIALIYAAREGRYDPSEFLLLIPKATLAPVLAFVIIAWWATGLSESKITFVNLPYFLVLSFALGFVTESLYVKIKELGNLIVGPSASASAARIDAAAQRDVYQFVHANVPPAMVPPASNLAGLREQLRSVARAAVERGLVAQLSSATTES